MMPASLSVLARRLNFIRETAPNDGAWVNFCQRFTHNNPGDSWCASFVSLILDIAYHGKPPLVRSASTQVLLAEAAAKGWIVDRAEVDDLYFYVKNGVPHHVGICSNITPSGVEGISGNTSPDGSSSNGTGVFEHAIGPAVFVRVKP